MVPVYVVKWSQVVHMALSYSGKHREQPVEVNSWGDGRNT
jgi:hypothetical protein